MLNHVLYNVLYILFYSMLYSIDIIHLLSDFNLFITVITIYK